MEIIDKIHGEFDNAVNVLKKHAKLSKQQALELALPGTDLEKARELQELGFSRVTSVVSTMTDVTAVTQLKESLLERSSSLKTIINRYAVFPYKIITYSQVIRICEEYGLILAPGNLYTGEVPDKNLQDIKKYPKDKIQEQFATNTTNYFFEPDFRDEPGGSGSTTFMICATLNEFHRENTMLVGRELIIDNSKRPKFQINKIEKRNKFKDPIVLYPLWSYPLNEQVFHVVTAWGPEARDPEVVNEKKN